MDDGTAKGPMTVGAEIKLLVAGINLKLASMDEEHQLAQKAMGIRPDLAGARRHADRAHQAILILAELILRGENLGVQQPIAVVDRINQRYEQVLDLLEEVRGCELVLACKPLVLN